MRLYIEGYMVTRWHRREILRDKEFHEARCVENQENPEDYRMLQGTTPVDALVLLPNSRVQCPYALECD
jgi:hypothetical protein